MQEKECISRVVS